uniref:Nuclear pore complex protein Nup153 n=1 Tax=Lepeophtheirus salmonis TaxID=72036 RepID=A0A0K2VK57_LEPSM
MIRNRSKKDVDNQVLIMEENLPSEYQRNLKGFEISKMYFEVGAFDSAKTYIDRYLSVRESSAVAHRFKGKLMEALNMKDKALISCKHAYELDPSISDTLLTIARLLTQVLPFDIEEARIWYSRAHKFSPNNSAVSKLCETILFHETQLNGEDSGPLNEKSSVLPSNFFSTPKTQSQRRFPPRPSPERLSAQFKQLESKQESSLAHLDERLAELEEKDEAILKILNDIMYEVRQGKTISQNISTEMTMLKKDLKDRDELRMTDITSAVAATSAAVTSLQQQQQHIQLAPREPDEDISLLKQKLKEAEKHAAIQQAAFLQLATSGYGIGGVRPQGTPAVMGLGFMRPDLQPVFPQNPNPQMKPTNWLHSTPEPISNVINNSNSNFVGTPIPPPIRQPVNNNAPTNIVISSSDKIPVVGKDPVPSFSGSVTIPPEHRLGVKPTMPIISPTAPMASSHSFQINLSHGGQKMVSPFKKVDGPAVSITTTALLSKIPDPIYSAVDTPTDHGHTSINRQRQTSVNSNYTDDDDHDPCPDFKPIIPLPEEVDVVTGEEEESTLFEDRSKLYRFVDKEWKERGIGQLKILKHNATGKIRVIMRRDQTLKICANHHVLPDIHIEKMMNQDKAVTWFANDFTDEEVRMENFSARFKTPEQADKFLAAFNDAKKAVRCSSTPSKKGALSSIVTTPPKLASSAEPSLSALFKSKPGSWECTQCYTRNEEDKMRCVACQTVQPGKENLAVESEAKSASTPVISFGTGGGFSFKTNSTTTPITTSASSVFSSLPLTSLDTSVSPFSSTYTIIPAATTESKSSVFSSSFTTTPVTTSSSSTISVFSSFNATPTAVTSTSVTETSKASPFSNFSFGADSSNFSSVFNFTTPKSETEKSATPFVGVVGSKVETFSFGKLNVSNNSLVNPPVENANAITNKSLSESKNESYADEEEHDPCPDFKPIIPLPEEIEVVTGEEDEDILFEARSKLYRFVINEWKERGIGQLKILRQKTTKKVRILMRRDQTLKVCANHFLMPEIIAERMKKKDNAVIWAANDFSDEEVKLEKFCAQFKTADIATQFIEAFDNAKANIPIGSPKKNVAKVDSSKVSEVETLGSLDKFKPEAGSWECPGCMCRNKANDIKCPACETIQPGKEGPKTPEKPSPALFGSISKSGFTFGANVTSPAPSTGFVFGKIETASTTPYKPPSEVADEMELSFENKSLKLNSAEDAKEVADKISSTKVMHTLTLSGNTIGIEAARALGKALETHPEFRRAHWKDMFTGRMKTEIPPALTHLSNGIMTANAQLVELDLSDNAFGPIGMEGLKDLLKSRSCYSLKELRLNNTGCGVTGGKHLADLLTKCLDNSTEMGAALALRVFVLGRSRQENEGAIALAKVFKRMKSLEEVVMPQNGIYYEGIAALMDAFSNNPKLRILNLNDNTFTLKGAESLAKVLPSMPNLEVLNIGDCLVKTEGAIKIAEALKKGHSSLKELHMDSNEITEKGGLSIVDAIANKKELTCLSIDSNQFGEDGCKSVLEQLKKIGKGNLISKFEDDQEADDDEEEDDDDNDNDDNNESVNESNEHESPKNNDNIFGGDSNIFSSLNGSKTQNLFGAATANNPDDTLQKQSPNNNIFGTPLFGKIFNTNNKGEDAGSPSKTDSKPSIPFSFGATKTEKDGVGGQEAGGGLFKSTNLPSFASLSSHTDSIFTFGNREDGFSFEGTGSTIFGKDQSGANTSRGVGEDPDESEHDPHFEPIIPLPELVVVSTGEEEEKVMFSHRSKVYRYETDTKEWKERGVGDIKILHHEGKNTFRVIFRRDQTLKIAVNHLISEDMVLKPLITSETALCWFAMDYSDEESKFEQFAVKFKEVATRNKFKSVFENSQEKLNASFKKDSSNTIVESSCGESTDLSIPDEEGSCVFVKVCQLYDSSTFLGTFALRIMCEDGLFRIFATQEDDDFVCNHYIMEDMTLNIDDNVCTWSAEDLIYEDSCVRSFKAVFDNDQDANDFKDTFYEGRDSAYDYVPVEQF